MSVAVSPGHHMGASWVGTWRPHTLQKGEEGPSLIPGRAGGGIAPGQAGALGSALGGGRLPSCPPAQPLWGWFAAPEGAPAAGPGLPVDRSPGGSQDPCWSAIFSLSEPLMLVSGVWLHQEQEGGGRREDAPPSVKQTQKNRSGPAVLRFRERPVQGVDMQSHRHSEAGLVLRGCEPAPTACPGCVARLVFLPAPRAGLCGHRRAGAASSLAAAAGAAELPRPSPTLQEGPSSRV